MGLKVKKFIDLFILWSPLKERALWLSIRKPDILVVYLGYIPNEKDSKDLHGPNKLIEALYCNCNQYEKTIRRYRYQVNYSR